MYRDALQGVDAWDDAGDYVPADQGHATAGEGDEPPSKPTPARR